MWESQRQKEGKNRVRMWWRYLSLELIMNWKKSVSPLMMSRGTTSVTSLSECLNWFSFRLMVNMYSLTVSVPGFKPLHTTYLHEDNNKNLFFFFFFEILHHMPSYYSETTVRTTDKLCKPALNYCINYWQAFRKDT